MCDWLTASSHDQHRSCKSCTSKCVGTNDCGSVGGARTSLEGLRRTSPTPPPLLKPWLRTVTMHISRESHVRSTSSPPSPSPPDGYIAPLLALVSQTFSENSEVNHKNPSCCRILSVTEDEPSDLFLLALNAKLRVQLSIKKQKQDVYDITVCLTPINRQLAMFSLGYI